MVLIKNVLYKMIIAIQRVSRYVYRLITRDTDVIASLEKQTAKETTRVEYLTQVLDAKKKLQEVRSQSKSLEQKISGLGKPSETVETAQ